MIFPSLPIHTIDRKRIKPAFRGNFDGGYEQTRPKYTRSIREFTVQFTALTITQCQTLETFFDDNQGLEVDFTDPVTDELFTVRFADDEITFKQVTRELLITSIKLREV